MGSSRWRRRFNCAGSRGLWRKSKAMSTPFLRRNATIQRVCALQHGLAPSDSADTVPLPASPRRDIHDPDFRISSRPPPRGGPASGRLAGRGDPRRGRTGSLRPHRSGAPGVGRLSPRPGLGRRLGAGAPAGRAVAGSGHRPDARFRRLLPAGQCRRGPGGQAPRPGSGRGGRAGRYARRRAETTGRGGRRQGRGARPAGPGPDLAGVDRPPVRGAPQERHRPHHGGRRAAGRVRPRRDRL